MESRKPCKRPPFPAMSAHFAHTLEDMEEKYVKIQFIELENSEGYLNQESLDLLKLSVEENPDSSHIKLLYGREFLNNYDLDNALKIFFDALDTKDIEYADNGLVLLQTLHYIGLCYYEQKNYDEAI